MPGWAQWADGKGRVGDITMIQLLTVDFRGPKEREEAGEGREGVYLRFLSSEATQAAAWNALWLLYHSSPFNVLVDCIDTNWWETRQTKPLRCRPVTYLVAAVDSAIPPVPSLDLVRCPCNLAGRSGKKRRSGLMGVLSIIVAGGGTQRSYRVLVAGAYTLRTF